MINLEPEVHDPPVASLDVGVQENHTGEFVEEKLDTPRQVRPWDLSYYHSYFDISTVTVLLRLKKTFYPFAANDFFEGGNPDLYCPIWACFTLVFLFAAGGNFTKFTETEGDIDWIDDLGKVTVAAGLFFGLLALVPFVSRFLMAQEASKPVWAELMSMYGYSFAVYIPGAIVCLFPIGGMRWLVLSVCAGWSCGLMFKNYRREFEGTGGWKRWVLAGLVLLGHAGVIVSGNLYFFG